MRVWVEEGSGSDLERPWGVGEGEGLSKARRGQRNELRRSPGNEGITVWAGVLGC